MKYIYLFGEYNGNNVYDLLGSKGANLSELINLGLSIPNGFIITTEACNQYYKDNKKINCEIQKQICEYISKLERITEKKFGNIDNPLLVSVKCESKSQIPMLMNTILNVGLTDNIVENLSEKNNEFIWIWECYLNFIYNYSKCVMGTNLEYFKSAEKFLKDCKSQLKIEDLRMIVKRLKEEYKLKNQIDFPDNPMEQLNSIINTSFKSWNNEKANTFRKDLDIPFSAGVAICIQSMVFGNINKNCGVGTVFTRDPITGEKNLVGNFSKKSFEKFVITEMESPLENSILSNEFPEVYNQLKSICELLEYHYKDMLKIEFVIENNNLFIIQVCKGKRTTSAALKIAIDFLEEYNLNTSIAKNYSLIKVKK